MKIKTSSGEVYELQHPEMVMFAKTALCVLHADTQGHATDRVEYISYLHVTSVETTLGQAA